MEMHSGNLSCEAGVNTTRTAIDEEYRQAELRLAQHVGSESRRLSERLDEIRSAHDVSWRDLLTSQRQIRRTVGTAAELTPVEFWERVAHPRSSLLRDRAIAVIDEHGRSLADACDRFRRTAATLRPDTLDVDSITVGHPLDAPSSAAIHQSVEQALAHFACTGLDQRPLDRLGRRWQRRLKLAALLKAGPAMATGEVEMAERVFGDAEIGLLNSLPWAHGDRILAAFELAHADVRHHLGEQLTLIAQGLPTGSTQRATSDDAPARFG